jgi:MFS family permease
MAADTNPERWRMLAVLSVAELLGMSLWFATSAVAPALRAIWGLSISETAWLTTIVQLGFVSGTAVLAVLNLADIVPARILFAISALLGAVANTAILAAPEYERALALRFLTGFFLAGVYPPAMKMIATWFRASRGLAIGTIVGALTIGTASPYLIRSIPQIGFRPVILAASTGAVAAAFVVLFGYRDGPYAFAARRFSWGHVPEVARIREWRLATASYLGHMFELYAFWAWIPAFLAASVAAEMGGRFRISRFVSLLAFATIAVGGFGSVWGGLFADKRGRERLVTISLVMSGACCVLSGFVFGGALWLLGALAMTWGFFVIADSAQFSTMVTESVPPYAVGTALTMQVSLGFLLTMLPMQILPRLAAVVGWRWSFAVLAVGPIVGIATIRRLVALRRTQPPSGAV